MLDYSKVRKSWEGFYQYRLRWKKRTLVCKVRKRTWSCEGKCFKSFGRLLEKETLLFSIFSPPKCVRDEWLGCSKRMVQDLGGFGKDSCKMELRKRAKFVGDVRGMLLSLSKRKVWIWCFPSRSSSCVWRCVSLWGASAVGSLCFLTRITSSGHQLFWGVSPRTVPVALRMPYFALANNRLIILLNSFGSYDEGHTDLQKIIAVMN